MVKQQPLFWYLLPWLSGLAICSAGLILMFSYFLNLRSERQLVTRLATDLSQPVMIELESAPAARVDSILGMHLAGSAELSLFDRDGNLLSGSAAQAGEKKHFEYILPMGGPRWIWQSDGLYYMVPMEEGPWKNNWLRLYYKSSPVAWTVDALPILSLSFLLIMAVMSLSWFVTHRLQGALNHLRKGVNLVSEGSYSVALPRMEWQELDEIGQALNMMGAELDSKIRRIEFQRQSQEAILSALDEGVLALDLQGRILNANPRSKEILSLGRYEQIEGERLDRLVRHTKLREIVEKHCKGFQPEAEEIEIFHDNGVHEVEVRGTTLRGADHEMVGVVLVIADLTRLRHLEQVRKDFVANVSHELRTPITSIQGFAETLASGEVDDPDQVNRFLGIIHRQSSRLSEIIDDLLQLSRLEQQRRLGEVEKEPIEIQELLEQCVSACENQANTGEFEIQLNCPAHLKMVGNPHLLEQAIVNLLTNAMKYSQPKKRIELNALKREETLIIQVCDQGFGIPVKDLNRVFERFYRVDKARSRSVGGTGLGLSIVRNIATAHGGEVRVESQVGVGSVFELHLPV